MSLVPVVGGDESSVATGARSVGGITLIGPASAEFGGSVSIGGSGISSFGVGTTGGNGATSAGGIASSAAGCEMVPAAAVGGEPPRDVAGEVRDPLLPDMIGAKLLLTGVPPLVVPATSAAELPAGVDSAAPAATVVVRLSVLKVDRTILP